MELAYPHFNGDRGVKVVVRGGTVEVWRGDFASEAKVHARGSVAPPTLPRAAVHGDDRGPRVERGQGLVGRMARIEWISTTPVGILCTVRHAKITACIDGMYAGYPYCLHTDTFGESVDFPAGCTVSPSRMANVPAVTCMVTIDVHEYWPRDTDPSAMLFRVGNHYLYVDGTPSHMVRFVARSKIVDFVAPLSNSDVPYPYATDTKGRRYLIPERVVLPPVDDPYAYYYARRMVCKAYPARETNASGIAAFFVGSEPYNLGWHSQAAEYNRLVGLGGPLSVVLTDGTRVELNRDSFQAIMDDFGAAAEFRSIDVVRVLSDPH